MSTTPNQPRPPTLTRGFTLIELLVVVAIIAVLMTLSVPAINSMSGSRTMEANLAALSGLLEFARTEAQARRTYVWVGFSNLPSTHSANASGSHQVAAAAFWSPDGTATVASGELQRLSKVIRLEQAKLVPGQGGELSGEMQSLLAAGGASPEALAASGSPKSLPGSANISFDQTLTFTPQGEALLEAEPVAGSPLPAVIDIGLKRMRGDQPDAASPDDGAVWVYGGSGRIRTWRLQ